jgi:hypothetical protein
MTIITREEADRAVQAGSATYDGHVVHDSVRYEIVTRYDLMRIDHVECRHEDTPHNAMT